MPKKVNCLTGYRNAFFYDINRKRSVTMAHFINVLFIASMFIVLTVTSVSRAANAEDAVLIMQLRVSPTVYGIDTIYRLYNYSVNGTLHSIVDTPRTIFHPAYTAEYDTLRKIKRLQEYRDTLINLTTFFWEGANKIRFEKQWISGQMSENGTIVYYGKLRSADLPENNSFAPENYLLVRADSTQYLDESGKIVTTWVWFYDSLDNTIKWQRRDPGEKELKWVEEYTYRYYTNGLIDRRSPALAGDMIINVYGCPTMIHQQRHTIKVNNNIVNLPGLKNTAYLVNGRNAGEIDNKNKLNMTALLLLQINSKQNSKSLLSLPGKNK